MQSGIIRVALSGALLALAASTALADQLVAAPGKNLDSLLAWARQHNPELAAMRAEADAVRERIESAGALPDPSARIELRDVSNEATGGNFNLLPARVGSTKYTLTQPLPFWGKRELRRELAEAAAAEAGARAETSWSELAARLKSAHAMRWQVARTDRLTREIDGLMVQLEELARTRYSHGLVPQQDVVRIQLERTALAAELIQLETEGHHQRARINALLRRPGHAPLAEPETLRPLPPAARLEVRGLDERLRARNPQLGEGSAQVLAAEKGRDLTYRNRYPDFAVGVSPIQQRNRVGEWELMFEMNIPLQQDSRRAQEREAEAVLAAAQSRREASVARLGGELAEALAGLDSARRIEALSTTRLLPQAELSFQSALAGYENGTLDFSTLLDAQRQIRKARLDIIKAQAEQQVRLAEIEKLVGEDL